MINLISALLFSFSANLDNIAIGISYGIKSIHITAFKNIIIAFSTSLFTFISMFLGSYLAMFLSENIANKIGAIFLISIGVYSLFKEIITKKKNNTDQNKKEIKAIGIKEILNIILILSINNVAAGIAASVAGINIICATIFTFIFSFSFLMMGNRIGTKATNYRFMEKYSNILSSLMLIAIGLIEI
ncbi:MAG: manganese efflux pump [Clostridia bacterium]|nr:manganese efflux pump [Clostridia bacterium]